MGWGAGGFVEVVEPVWSAEVVLPAMRQQSCVHRLRPPNLVKPKVHDRGPAFGAGDMSKTGVSHLYWPSWTQHGRLLRAVAGR